MPNAQTDGPPEALPRQSSPGEYVVPPLCFLAAVIMGADFTAIDLRPLRALQIPYPSLLDYAHFIVPIACAALWLVTLRKWPVVGPIVAVLLCFTLISLIPRYAQTRVAAIPLTRWIEPPDLDAMQDRIGFKVMEQGSGRRVLLYVAPQHESQARAEFERLALAPPPAATEK
jgi:hypothetical protein